MNHSIKTKPRKHNTMAINSLAVKYGFSKRYITEIIENNRTPVFADKIKADYKALDAQMSELLNKQEL
jgi:hypothetical protein